MANATGEQACTPAPDDVCPLCSGREFTTLEITGNGCVMQRCQSCGLWTNISHRFPDLRQHYAEEYHALHYGHSAKRKVRQAKLIVRQIEGLRKGGRFLDIGCSYGHVLQAAQAAGYEAYGAEVSESMVAHCHDLGLRVELAGMGELPYEDGFFQVVHLRHVLEHDTAVDHNLQEIRRVLAPDGVLVVEVPDCDCPKVKQRGGSYARFWKYDHMLGFTRATLKAFMERNGFAEVPVRPYVGLFGGRSSAAWALLIWRSVHLFVDAIGQGKAFLTVWRRGD